MSSNIIRHARRAVFLIAAVLLWTGGSKAQECAEAECDFQVDETVIREDLWRAPCDTLNVSALDPRHFGPPGIRAPSHFVRGVCLVERIARGLPPLADATRMSPVESAIAEFQLAQSTAMLPSQRTAAALFEGLMHCKQLDALGDSGRAPGTPATGRRCFHRAMAKASFARVDLAGLRIRHTDPAGAARFDQSIEGMLACQATHLHEREAATCGTLISASSAELTQIADTVADQVLTRFFGNPTTVNGRSAIPPVTAMIGRKISEAKAATEGSNEAFAKLQAERDEVVGSYKVLGTRLCNEDKQSCAPAAVADLLERYSDAIEEVAKYTAFVEQATEGLFLDENKQGVGRDVEANLRSATDAIKALEPKLASLETLKSQLTRLAVDPQGTETVRRACRLLFCDILADIPLRIRRACDSVDPSSPTRAPLRAGNPLCGLHPSDPALDTAAASAARNVCRAAGFAATASACD